MPATITRGTTTVDPDLEDAVAEFQDAPQDTNGTEPDDDDEEGGKLTRGRVKFDGNLANHERALRQRMAIKLRNYDEKQVQAREAYVAKLEEDLSVEMGRVALKADPSKVTNPEQVAAAIRAQIAKQEANIKALMDQLTALAPATSEQ